jgi:hypothetical protein
VRKLLTATLCLALASLIGCQKGEKLFRVSGTVTYDGKPIPKGLIYFEPQGDSPQGFADIVNGKYETAEKNGIRGGSYNIRVNGFNGIQGPDAPFGQGLFPEYTGTKDLPQEDSTYDLDIPKSR